MRRLGILASAWLVLAGCAAPQSDGGLWARQGLQQELALSRISESRRAAQAHAYELTLADEQIAAQGQRLQQELRDCPGANRVPLQVSPAASIRDALRLRVGEDEPRRAVLAQQALIDWYLRRARATGNADLCDKARTTQPTATPFAQTPFGAEAATVVRTSLGDRPRYAENQPPDVLLALYVLGWADGVQAPAPLPHYLAAVYGGTVQPPPAFQGSAEDEVDRIAPELPQWEPDALWSWLKPQP
jgi:hypothetical protein